MDAEPKQRHGLVGTGLLALALVATSCARSRHSEPIKNTNWLQACDTHTTCGSSLTCLCGICTQRCRTADECADPGGATCRSIEDEALSVNCAAGETRDAFAICIASIEPDDSGSAGSTSSDAPDAAAGTDSGGSRMDAAGDDSALPPVCGNGLVEQGELCDGTPPANAGCDDCAVVCSPGFADCNADPADGCEIEGLAAADPCACDAIGGKCVEFVAVDQPGPISLAIDSTHLYWLTRGMSSEVGENGKLLAWPLAGGEIVTLADGLHEPRQLVLDPPYAYWINMWRLDEGGAVMRVPLAGGTKEAVATGLPNPSGLGVDEADLYFSLLNGGSSMYRMPKDGSAAAVELFAVSGELIGNPLMHDSRLYWMSGRHVFSAAIIAGQPIELVPLMEGMFSYDFTGNQLSIFESRLYYLSNAWAQGLSLESATLDGSDQVMLASDTLDRYVHGLAVDATGVYWGRGPQLRTQSTWAIMRTTHTGETQTMIEDPRLSIPAIVVTATSIYVAATGGEWSGPDGVLPNGFVMRLAK